MAESGIVEIRGKEYYTVAKRVDMFRSDYPGFSIETDIISQAELVTVKATIKDESGKVISTGYAEENRGVGNINKTSALENAETSAVGRALAFFGLAGTEIASANEVSDAIVQQAVKDIVDSHVRHVRAVDENLESIIAVKNCIASDDIEGAAEAWYELDQQVMTDLWVAPTKGGIFTTKERDIMKNQFSQYKRVEE